MALRSLPALWAAAALALPASAAAQAESAVPAAPSPELAPAPAPEPAEAPAAPAEEVQPPVPRTSLEIPLPEGTPPPEETVTVQVTLVIDETGAVTEVRLDEGAGPPWDDAVLAAAKAFLFDPARYGGQPVAVEIPFVQRFEPPPAPTVEERQLPAALRGTVVEKGTGKPVARAPIEVAIGGETFRTESDADGAFELRLPDGEAKVEVQVSGYHRFRVSERLRAGDALSVRYLVERRNYNPFETIVIGRPERQEVARTTLRDRELTRVPGTFGDPFRVVSALPGVGQMMSLLSYPIVRGASPGNTGMLLDGVRIPQLFHYLAGPSVIHPEFVDRIDFYPGVFPVEYGGYTGGIVDGVTRRARLDEDRTEIGADLTNASGFLRQPVLGATGTVAGRYGYPGALLSAFAEDAFVSYWDYQARLDGGPADSRWTVFAFGAYDEVGETVDGEESNSLRSLFHRVDLRYRDGTDRSYGSYALSFGFDQLATVSSQEDPETFEIERDVQSLDSFSITPRLQWLHPVGRKVSLRLGLDGGYSRRLVPEELREAQDEAEDEFGLETWLAQAGGFFEVPWWLTEDFLLTPGARVDVWENSVVRRASLDPRIFGRLRIDRRETSETWLKGGVGLFHQPPRLPVPVPGLEALALVEGLNESVQTSVGAEHELTSGYAFDVTTYFNYMDPQILDLFGVNGAPTGGGGGEGNEEDDEASGPGDLTTIGRSFGVEVMLRRRDGGDLFGWIAYTLSRSERRHGGEWERYEFDRTHMLHLVGGLRLPRNWEIGGRLQLQTGRPLNAVGEEIVLAKPFTRLDIRIDKRAVYNEWMLDFYVELINALFVPEEMAQGSDGSLRYIFPTIGFRAVL